MLALSPAHAAYLSGVYTLTGTCHKPTACLLGVYTLTNLTVESSFHNTEGAYGHDLSEDKAKCTERMEAVISIGGCYYGDCSRKEGMQLEVCNP
jgi:hypothetical protein